MMQSTGHALTDANRRQDVVAFRRLTVFIAIAAPLVGATIGLFPGLLGLDFEDARFIATGLLGVGIADTLVLLNWTRWFSRP
jgi:hypothetical protein